MVTLAGRCAIVTGAAGGFGRAFSESLVGAGVNVALCDVQPEVIAAARALSGPGRAIGIVADIARDADVVRLIEAAVRAFGRIDTLIDNAAVWRRTPVTDGFDKALDDWDAIMATNLRGTLMLSRACAPHIVAAGGGDIVLIGSADVLPAKSAPANPADTDLYTASKWALNGFVQAWALALARKRVRVNALCVGPTETPMLHALIAAGVAADGARLKPEAVAALLVALLEEGPDGRTGENVGAWPGEPVARGPRKPAHRAVTG
jgi:NAD(P)-dependent dehydrogenase (short-subunit alcohol dehydrogenase family)